MSKIINKFYKKNFDHLVVKKYFKILIPGIGASLILGLYGIVDSLFAGQALSDIGLIAMSYSTIFIILLVSFGYAVGSGLSAKIIKAKANNSKEEAQKCIDSFLPLTLIISIPFMIFGIFFAEYFVWITAGFKFPSSDVLTQASEYIKVLSYFTFPFLLVIVTDDLILNQNKAGTSFSFSFVGFIINIVLNYVFMFQLKWGLMGAALGTGIAQIATGFFQLLYLMIKSPLKIKKVNFIYGSKIFFDVFKRGGAMFLNSLIFAILLLNFTFFFGIYGGNESENLSGAFIIVYSAYQFFLTFPTMMGRSAQQIVVHEYHVKNNFKLNTILKLETIFVVAFGIITTLAIVIFPNWIADIFISTTSPDEIKEIANFMLPIFFSTFLFASLNMVYPIFLQNIEFKKTGLLLSFMSILLLPIISVIVGTIATNLSWLVISVVISNVITFISIIGVMLYIWLKREKSFLHI